MLMKTLMRILMNPVQNLLITIHASMTLNLMMMTTKLVTGNLNS